MKMMAKISHFHCFAASIELETCPAEWLQQLQIASLGSEANTPMLKMTYLCVLVWAGEGVWSHWQVLRWEGSREDRQEMRAGGNI